ncbi:MAG: HoxN/HupN/NixA family nickel/cobalt transporter [Verrucomicrobia bacterium]|nr:HoxN/HupN/NixA family nickel/cobalt transporter [Verrucomicrobiota bacterium]
MSQASSHGFKTRVVAIYTGLILANIGAWIWPALVFSEKPLLLGTALLAYSFGLRHAVDADHIAAIDNVTRKLMQDGQRPVTVGFYFSLGHSTIVVVASLVVYAAASMLLQRQLDTVREIGSIVGTSISASFLLAIALINLVILRGVWRTFQEARRNGGCHNENPETLLGSGFLGRLFRPLFRMLAHPWQMYPVGLLFGLGFDTATEVAILGISAAAAAKGLSMQAMAVFPVLFTAGMTLVDTTDGILMTGAYGWAFVKPVRKLYYNLTITFVSVVIALFIGGIEAIGLLKDQLKLTGGVWDLVGNLNDNFGTLGFVIIGIFVVCWIGSVVIYRIKGFDRLESSVTATSEYDGRSRLRRVRSHLGTCSEFGVSSQRDKKPLF